MKKELVKQLYDKGYGMLDSKRALELNDWDIEKAEAYLIERSKLTLGTLDTNPAFNEWRRKHYKD